MCCHGGHPQNVSVLVGEATFPGCVIRARPVGLFEMRDEKGPDEKILCVPIGDPQWNWVRKLSDVPEHLRREITHFFEVYKEMEAKETEVGGWLDAEVAWERIQAARDRYVP